MVGQKSVNPVLIALGANLPSKAGPPEQTLRAALDALGAGGLRVLAESPFYRTPCFPSGAGPDYVNAAALAESALRPDEILALLHRIEADHGRERVQRWGMRTLDLDLVACGQTVLPDPGTQTRWRDLPLEAQMQDTPDRLILPHPRLQDRAFVLVPLADVAPDWVHPLTGQSVRDMRDALPTALRDEVTPL